jgi:hypothetical protein
MEFILALLALFRNPCFADTIDIHLSPPLNFDGGAYGTYDAAELNESAVPGILDDAAAMISDLGIDKRLSESSQLRLRAFFVDPYQAARARNIRHQNSRQSPLYVLVAQDAPPGSGKLNCRYSTIADRCPAMPTSEMGQTRHFGRAPLTSGLVQ